MRLPVVIAFALLACGPGKPGPVANQTYFWRVTSSNVEFGSMCSDDPQFRASNGPLKFESNSYIVYKASADDRKATLMTCTTLDPGSCLPATSGVIFDVAGAELSFATELKTPSGQGMCNVLDSQMWLMIDKSSTLDVSIADTLSLVDDMTTCDRLEADAKAASPNHMGYQGCTITFKVGASSH
jgi:hypothetical protein